MRRVRFPKRIKRGSCVVTIYKTPTNGYDSFTVVHYDAKGTRCRRSFADYTWIGSERFLGQAQQRHDVHVSGCTPAKTHRNQR